VSDAPPSPGGCRPPGRGRRDSGQGAACQALSPTRGRSKTEETLNLLANWSATDTAQLEADLAAGDEQAHDPDPVARLDRSAILNSLVQYSTTVDRAFAALADPTRRAVLERLGPGSATISALAEPFGMSLTGMKKHIRLLEEANLVATEKVGRARRCTLVPYAFEGISTWLQRLDRFAQVVERTKGAR
jgi:DNA-binding transcriptional ArsR family regulator